MKKSLLPAAVFGILSGISMPACAQYTKVPRFIDNIEIVPKIYRGQMIATTNVIKPDITFVATQAKLNAASPDDIEKCTTLQFKYALLLNRDVESVNNVVLYKFIEDWLKTPYHYGGEDKDGIDCSSFTCTLMQKVYGFELPRLAKDQYDKCAKVAREDLQEGDLVFFHTRKGVSHVGVYLGNNYFVHSSTHSGVTIDNLNEAYYNKRYIGGGRISQ